MDFAFYVSMKINKVVWSPIFLIGLMFLGIYFTIKTRFFQFTGLKVLLKNTFLKKETDSKKERGISPFQAMSTALAGTIGVGNIIGVGAALVTGGPGAIFWMWVSGLFGAMTKYAEVFLSVKYKEYDKDGAPQGGPMYYIKNGLKSPLLAAIFSVACLLASFGIGNMIQSNAVAKSMEVFGAPTSVTGVILGLAIGLVTIGGIKRIGKLSAYLVPIMSVCFILLTGGIVIINIDSVGAVLKLIVNSAFDFKSAAGGVLGYGCIMAFKTGVTTGMFSNEAGLGSAPIAHGASSATDPQIQGMWGIVEVLIDTVVVCTLTAVAILCTGVISSTGLGDGTQLAKLSYIAAYGDMGGYILGIGVSVFAFSSMLSWCYYGAQSVRYLTGGSGKIEFLYKIAYVVVVIVSATGSFRMLLAFSDTLNFFMMAVNIIALIALRREVTIKEK